MEKGSQIIISSLSISGYEPGAHRCYYDEGILARSERNRFISFDLNIEQELISINGHPSSQIGWFQGPPNPMLTQVNP